MATQELVAQLNPEHYDNLTDANAIGRTNFGISSCQNNTGTVFAIGSDDNVTVYTSNLYATKYATSISNPGNSNSLFGFKIAMDSPGDTIIVGAPGDNRAYVFDAQNQARTTWTQRSSGWNNNSYLGTSDSGTIHYGSDVDVAGDDDSLFVIGRPGDHKIELWSWPKGSSATLLTTITHSDNFGFSCKLSADGQVVIAGGPGNYYPSYSNAYGNGLAYVYAKDPLNASTWTQRTLPFDYTDCPTYVEYTDAKLTTIKSVTDTTIESGGTRTPVNPAFGFSVAINKDGTFIAVSAPNRRCFFAAEWINDTSYNWLTGKPVTGEKDSFGTFLFMQYDGTRIVTGNSSIEEKYYWDGGGIFPRWDTTNYLPKSYCILDWNGIYYTNYSESFNLYSLGGLPTSMSKNGEFCLFSMKYDYNGFTGNEARVTGSNRTTYGGSTVFSFTRFAPTIKILGTTTIGGDLKVRFLSVGGDKSYIESNTNAGYVTGYINFENTKDEHSIFRSQIINTSQYTGDDNLSELLLFKSGHVRGLNSRGPDRIRIKSPSVILEGMTCENHPLYVPTPDSIGVVSEVWSKFLKEASAVYSRLTLTGIGNVGIGVPEYADHIIKENWNLGSTSIVEASDFHKQNENANAQAPPLINHRLVIDGTQSIQNGKLYINNPISSNLTTDGMSACYNTMTSDCIKNTNTTNIPYVICDIKKRNPYLNREDGYVYYEDRMKLYNTITYDDVNKGLYFGTSTSYAQGFIHEARDTITGNVTNALSGVYTVSYWFMLKDYAQSTFGTSGQLVFTAYRDTAFGYGHKITSSGFKIQYSPDNSTAVNIPVEADYTVNYTFSQNVWYHVCVKVDNTDGNGATEGTATTQLWINGVSQSLTANETVRDMQGRFPRFCYFGVVNQAVNQTQYGYMTGNHTLGGDGMYGHLISNIKIYIAHDGTDSFERVAVPDYNSASDFYNEGPPNEGISLSGGMNISGHLRVNGSTGTSGQVLTSSGSGAPTWTTVSSSPWSTLNSNVYYNSGKVGIGTSTPDSLLTLNSSSNHTVTIDSGTYTSFLHMNRTNGNWYATTDNTDTWNQNLYWLANTSDTGNPLKRILRFENDTASAGSNAIGTFTGQHMSSIIDVKPNNVNDYVGLIVSSNQNDYMTVSGVPLRGAKNIHVNEAIPIVKITSKAYDKSCFGVLSSSEDTNERSQVMGQIRSYFYKEDGDTRVYVNSIGEGGIWIVNENGVLESGDYITTSNVSGYGMKQDSEFLANYTVAKITMDCDFNPKQVPVKQIKKINKLVTYYVHNSDNTTISENEYIKLDNVQKQEYTQETKTETVNDLDSNGEFQWEDTLETELEYSVRYLDINGIETTQENSVYTAAFVGCTYHCG